MSKTFKVGDAVYCPILGNKIFTLTKNSTKSSKRIYPLRISFPEYGEYGEIFDEYGKYNLNDLNNSLFHVTKENQELLSKLYGIQFEEPKSFLDHHLSLGSKVLCLICRNEKYKLPSKIWELDSNIQFIDVIVEHTSDNEFINDMGFIMKWKYVYPIEVTSTGQINYLS